MSEFVLGGVTLEVVGSLILPPAQPNPTEDVNWATSQLETSTPVVMVNGNPWRLLRTPTVLEDGRYLVEIRSSTGRVQRQYFIVPADSVTTAIWNTNQPIPTPPEPDPEPELPVVVPDPPLPDPVSPTDPVAPSSTPEIPVESTEPVVP